VIREKNQILEKTGIESELCKKYTTAETKISQDKRWKYVRGATTTITTTTNNIIFLKKMKNK